MTGTTHTNEHPLIEELYVIARYKWTTARECTTLLSHPLVAHTAGGSEDASERVKALRKCFKQTVTYLNRKEKKEGLRPGRSVGKASTKLLRLQNEYEEASLTALREMVATEWKNRSGKTMSYDGFRLHCEREQVFRVFAEEFLLFAGEELKKLGIEAEEGNGAHFEAPPRTMPERVAKRLAKLESEWHEKRLETLAADGSFKIKDEDEMLAVLLSLNDFAERGFRAVDLTPISKWSSNSRLKKYLRQQLKRIKESEGKLTLERIRLVTDSELTDKNSRRHLVKFVKDHKAAGASLLLFPISALERVEVTFQPHNGLLLADAEAEPIAVTGRLGEGTIGRAFIHTRESNEMGALLSEYESLKSAAAENDYDSALRKQLTTRSR